MLGKLIKHEFHAGLKLIVLMNFFTVLMTGIACIVLCGIVSGVKRNMEPTAWQMVIIAAVFIAYVLTLLTAGIGAMLYVAVRYAKNLYGNEGYLMHTLPVTPKALLLSRAVVHALYCLVTNLLVAASVFTLAFTVLHMLGLLETFWLEFARTKEAFEQGMGTSLENWICMIAIAFVLNTFATIFQIYLSVAIGNLAAKYKTLTAIGAYIATNVLMQAVGVAIAGIVGGSRISRIGLFMGITPMHTSVAAVVSTAVFGVVFYALSEWLLRKKLNLD